MSLADFLLCSVKFSIILLVPLDSIPLPPIYSMLVISTQHDIRFRPFQGSFLNFVSILLNQDNLAHRFQSPSLSKQNSLADIPALIFFVAEDVMSTIHLMERDAIPHIVPACSHTCPHLRHEHLEATHLTLGVHRTGGIWLSCLVAHRPSGRQNGMADHAR